MREETRLEESVAVIAEGPGRVQHLLGLRASVSLIGRSDMDQWPQCGTLLMHHVICEV